MIDKVSGWISYKLYKCNIIKEEDFETYDYIIGMGMFGLISTTSFILLGVVLGQTKPMLISMFGFWLILQILNYKPNVHSESFLGCGIFTTCHLLINLYGSIYLTKLFYFNNCHFIYSLLIAIITVSFMVSSRGIKCMRWIEKHLFIWNRD